MIKGSKTTFALCLLAAGAVTSDRAAAYDPCQRAHEDRAVARDAVNRYVGNQCPASARYIPQDCRQPQRGAELVHALHVATARVQRACNI